MRILVVGGRGNVGAPAAAALRAAGVDVVLGVRAPAEPGEVTLDLLSPATFRAAVEGCDGMFLVRPPHISDVKRTLNPLIDIAHAAGVRHVVFLSVLGAERSTVIPHRKVELHLLESEAPWTFLRAGFFMQNLTGAYLASVRAERALRLPAGTAKLAFIDARDIGSVAARAFVDETLRGRALELTGAEALSFAEVAQVMTEVLRVPIRYDDVAAPRYFLETLRTLSPMQALVQTLIHVQVRGGGAARVLPTVGELLGHPPRTMRAFIAENAAALVG